MCFGSLIIAVTPTHKSAQPFAHTCPASAAMSVPAFLSLNGVLDSHAQDLWEAGFPHKRYKRQGIAAAAGNAALYAATAIFFRAAGFFAAGFRSTPKQPESHSMAPGVSSQPFLPRVA